MAQEFINIGTANAKEGDTLHSAFTKTQDNFTELYANTTLDQLKVIYVAKAGDDSNSGFNVNSPKLTISGAILDAVALTPIETNQIAIQVLDTGTYFETVNLPEWVHIDAQNAALNGRLTVSDSTITRFRRLQNGTVDAVVVRKLLGTGFARVACDLMVVETSGQEGLLVNMGLAHLDVGVLTVDAGVGIKAKNGSRVSFDVKELLLSGGGLGIGTRTADGAANSFSGNILYAVDEDNTGTLLEAKVSGDVINVQAGSLIANTLYDMGAGTTLNVFANEVSGAVIADPTATVNSTISGVSNFNSTTDIVIDRVLEAVSLASVQEPSGLGIANAIQIEFGVAQFTASDPVMIDVNGTVTFNDAGLYRIKSVFQFGRSGASGTSELLFRLVIDGAQSGRSVGVKLGNSDVLQYIDIDNWFNVPAGTVMDTEIMRDNSGSNSGGIFKTSPTNEGAGTWGDVPCTVLRIERWASP
jgi:hypothetical protein